MSQELPFQLMAWIKKDQAERQAHKERMVKKNYQEDDQYMRFMSFLVREWNSLKPKDREKVISFGKWHEANKNFSVNQRSAIAGMYMTYVLEPEAKKK